MITLQQFPMSACQVRVSHKLQGIEDCDDSSFYSLNFKEQQII